MKTISMKAWFVPGILATALLAACGGGGGGGGDPEVAFNPTSEASLFRIADAPVETDNPVDIRVVNNTGEKLEAVQVLLSTLRDEVLPSTSEEVVSTTVKARDVLLYSSSAVGLPTIANTASGTFSLKNVNFAAASSDTSGSASATTCLSTSDAALGTVRLEVFSQGSQLWQKDVNVCAVQAGYTVDL